MAIKMGEHTYCSDPVKIYGGQQANLTVGKFCSISTEVSVFLGAEHNVNWVSTYPFNKKWPAYKHGDKSHPKTKGDIVIGNDVLISHGVTILSGVTIGDGAVIGAMVLVVKDVPPYAIVGGVPAKLIRYRFDNDTIEKLLLMKWWDWPEKKIDENIDLLMSGDIGRFINENS